jgi:hypothetical protein
MMRDEGRYEASTNHCIVAPIYQACFCCVPFIYARMFSICAHRVDEENVMREIALKCGHRGTYASASAYARGPSEPRSVRASLPGRVRHEFVLLICEDVLLRRLWLGEHDT